VGRGSDVLMDDAAGAAGTGANGAGGPAGRAESEASVRSGSRRDGSSADHGRDLQGGDYPDGADDQEAEPPLLEGAGPTPSRRTYLSPPSHGTRDGVPVMGDDVLMDAETNNSRVASVRIEQGHWGVPPGFVDILNGVPDEHFDAVVAKVHGNANYGNQGKPRQAYEVLAYANELVRYGQPFHDFHTRLSAWALLFRVHQMGTFQVAANNFGRPRRVWPQAVFLSRRTATELSVPFAQDAGMEEDLDELIEADCEAELSVEEKLEPRTLALSSPFRAQSYAPAHRRAQDAARISSRGLLPTAWCSGVIRAPRHFDLSRWFPRYPRWWLNRGVWMEMPYALSLLAHTLVYEFIAAWHVVNAEYYYFVASGWVHTLLTDKAFAWLNAKALKRMSKLDLHRMASGPGGQAMLDTFQKMNKATAVFMWTILVKDVIRRDTQTRTARRVHVHLDSLAEYGFMLNHPCRGFSSLPVCGGGSDDDGDTHAAAAQSSGGFVCQGTREAGRPARPAASASCRSLSPVRETRVTAASRGHVRPTQEDVWTSPEAFEAAVALFGDGPSRRMDGQRVPRGVGAAALFSAWNRQTEALLRAVRDAYGYVLEDAMPVLDRSMSVAADSAAAFDLFAEEVERLRQVAAVPPSPVRFDAGDILGWRFSRADEDEEDSPPNMRRRSSSVDGGSRGHFRNQGGWSKTGVGSTYVFVLLGLFYCRCPSSGDAVAVLYTPCPLMGCCHLDREGLACVALLVFLLKWKATSAHVVISLWSFDAWGSTSCDAQAALASAYQGVLSHLGAISVASVLWYIRSSTVVVRSWTKGRSSPLGSDPTTWVTGVGGASFTCKDGGQGHT